MEEKLVSEYIGKDAEKFIGTNVNWSAGILGQVFGPVWFFYRKSYLIGVLFIIITIIVGNIASSLEIKEASYIMFFIYLFTANKLYVWDVKRKVNKILSTRKDMSEEEIISYVREKGGTSTLAAVIYSIVLIAIIFIYIALIYSTINTLMSI